MELTADKTGPTEFNGPMAELCPGNVFHAQRKPFGIKLRSANTTDLYGAKRGLNLSATQGILTKARLYCDQVLQLMPRPDCYKLRNPSLTLPFDSGLMTI
jgi:hypothetical protein